MRMSRAGLSNVRTPRSIPNSEKKADFHPENPSQSKESPHYRPGPLLLRSFTAAIVYRRAAGDGWASEPLGTAVPNPTATRASAYGLAVNEESPPSSLIPSLVYPRAIRSLVLFFRLFICAKVGISSRRSLSTCAIVRRVGWAARNVSPRLRSKLVQN
jgi:hypothetical protein